MSTETRPQPRDEDGFPPVPPSREVRKFLLALGRKYARLLAELRLKAREAGYRGRKRRP
ncbi:hypothetical protein JCM10213_001119, partial [Rhodosporidiobolus nylandii]